MATFNNGDTYLSIRELLNDTGLRKNNFEGSTAPTIDADTSEGYEIGSLWLDTTTNTMYYAVDVTNSAAVWRELDLAGSYGNVEVQAYLDAQGYSNVDLDAQTLAWDSANANLSITNGNTITLDGVTAQDISWDEANSNLSITGGSTVTLSGLDTQSLAWDTANSNLSISNGNTVTIDIPSGLDANANIATDFVNLTVTNSAELANVQLELAKYRLTSGAVTYPNGRPGGPIIYINVEPGTYVLSDYFSVQDMVGQVRFQAPGGNDHRANTSIRFDGQMNIINSHVRFDGLTVISNNWMNILQQSVMKMQNCNVWTSYTSTSASSYSSVIDCTVCETSPGANDAEFYWDAYESAHTYLNRNDYSAVTGGLIIVSGSGCQVYMQTVGDVPTGSSTVLRAERQGKFYLTNSFTASPGLLDLPNVECYNGGEFTYVLNTVSSNAYAVNLTGLEARNGGIVNFNSGASTANIDVTGSVLITDGSHVNFDHGALVKLASVGPSDIQVLNGSSLTVNSNVEIANVTVDNSTVGLSGTVTPLASKNLTLTNGSRLVIGDLGAATTITASGHSRADVLADTAGVVGSSTITANDFSEIITPNGRTGYAVGYDPLTDQIVIGNGASASGNSGVAIGHDATSPLNFATAIGPFTQANGAGAIAIGSSAGSTTTSNTTAGIYIGQNNGTASSGAYQISIGEGAGSSVSGAQTIAIGRSAGRTNSQPNSIAIGTDAGNIGHGEFSIALGYESGKNGTANNTIGINATGTTVAVGSQFGIDIRTSANGSITYDTTNAWVFGSQVSAPTVAATTGTVRLANLTTTERNGLTAANGDMIYNITDSKLQGYQAGVWINLDGT